jgi:hypothetical protein|tara:strand:- start:857 stop:979 length:123 start_codon:yes stop_codon:yes gene_type:complete
MIVRGVSGLAQSAVTGVIFLVLVDREVPDSDGVTVYTMAI